MTQDAQAAEKNDMSRFDAIIDRRRADDEEARREMTGEEPPKNKDDENSEFLNDTLPEGELEGGEDDKSRKPSGSDNKDGDKGKKKEEASPLEPELVDRAIRAGMNGEKARKMPDNDALYDVVKLLEKGAEKADKPKEGKSSEDESGEQDEIGEKLKKIANLDPDEFAPELAAAVNALRDVGNSLNQGFKELRKGMASSGQSFIEDKIAELPKEYQHLFAADAKYDAKAVLSDTYALVMANAEKSGKYMTRAKALEKAVEVAFPTETDAVKGKQISEKSSERSKKAQNRPRGGDGQFTPSDRKSGNGSYEERRAEATAFVKKKMAANED